MKRRFRLRRPAEIGRALGSRRIFAGEALVAFAVPAAGPTRVGVAVSRQVKGSVLRNRARRRLREVSRRVLLGPDSPLGVGGIRYDVVLIARPAAATAPFTTLESEAEAFLARLRPVSG
ncbi:MAG TPA: ribonuclease P protein component [Candidatus Acidoferrales bacterium]|nr:ribonuclease P protein component [Candidatus Acidoferrales bacterium]